MFDEPRRHRLFMSAVAGVALFTAPFPFIGRELVLVWGLPLWLWWSFALTATLSALTAWGMLRLWHDDTRRKDDRSGIDSSGIDSSEPDDPDQVGHR